MNVGVNLSADPQNGSIFMYNGSGLMTVNNGAQLTAANLFLQSGDGILVDSIAPLKAAQMVITAGNGPGDAATVQNTDLSNLGALNVNAQTIVLQNVALPRFRQHRLCQCQWRPGAQTRILMPVRRAWRCKLHFERASPIRAGWRILPACELHHRSHPPPVVT